MCELLKSWLRANAASTSLSEEEAQHSLMSEGLKVPQIPADKLKETLTHSIEAPWGELAA